MHRLLIISPNLEPGLCGVSDYTLELRLQILKNNKDVEVRVLALSDLYIKDVIGNDFYYRIPNTFRNSLRIKYALKFVNEYKPSRIYFNLISYGYQSKGLPMYISNFFNYINVPIIVIAHELWIGNFSNEALKKKVIGYIQKLSILKILKKGVISRILVTTDISKNILHYNNIEATTLPVFNNIPISLCNNKLSQNMNHVTFLFFGSFAFQINAELFIKFIKNEFLDKGKIVIINHVGIYRGYTQEWEYIQSTLSKLKVVFKIYGIITSERISELLQQADYGITSYMPQFWSKSGSIAAMLAHGLPVISISKENDLPQYTNHIRSNDRINHISNLDIQKLIKFPTDVLYNDKLFDQIQQYTN